MILHALIFWHRVQQYAHVRKQSNYRVRSDDDVYIQIIYTHTHTHIYALFKHIK